MPRARELLILLIVGTITAHRLLAGDPAAGAANLAARPGFVDASQFGFSPAASGVENMRALQQALDQTGTITISRPGTYKLAGTVFIGSHTALVCGANVALMKVDEQGPFSHVLLNKGALTKTYDEHIAVTGLNVIVNGIDVRKFLVYGLHGQIAFFYVKNLRIDNFRCEDIGKAQYGIHVCTFEDLLIENVLLKGDKDGVHLGRGKRFTIRNATFQTFDDAIALNGHDYDVGNPELGWIEEGLVENCRDLADNKRRIGYFCRILAGGWREWEPGIVVQKSDTVISGGRLYRVFANPDEKQYKSVTRPTHESGAQELDGIKWVMVQNDVTATAGVRNVTFRSIFLSKPRTGFSIHFDQDKYSRSYYPGSPVPQQEQLRFDDIRVLYDEPALLFDVWTPVDSLSVTNSHLRNNRIRFHGKAAITDWGTTKIAFNNCVFAHHGPLELISNELPQRRIELQTQGSVVLHGDFTAKVSPGPGSISVRSDLPGLTP
jgi:hypothetical protein